MVDWTKQTGDKDLGREIYASATGKLGGEINGCTTRSVLRPFEVYSGADTGFQKRGVVDE